MKDIKQQDLMNKYKIFSAQYYEKPYSGAKNTTDFLLELKQEWNFWNKIDTSNSLQKGISTKLKDVIDAIEQTINEDISKNDLYNEYSFASYINKKIYPHLNPIYSFSNSIINFNFDFFSKDFKDITKIEEGYIFCEKNYENDDEIVRCFFELYKNQTNLSSYVYSSRSSAQYKALILFLSLETKSIKSINKVDDVESKINIIKEDMSCIEEEVSAIRNNLISYSNDYRETYDAWTKEKEDWFLEKENEIDEIKKKYSDRMHELEQVYSEKLKLEEPVKFWQSKADEMLKNYRFYLFVTIALSFIVLLTGRCLVEKLYYISINGKTHTDVIPFSFVIVAVISFLIYFLRTFIKLVLSSKHLQTEYLQKANFTYFYLSLLNNQSTHNQISESEKNLIYNNLFSNPEIGLIKGGQDNADVLSYISAILTKTK